PVLVLYHFVLVERKYSVLLGQQQFLVERPLTLLEQGLFVVLFPVEILVFLLTASILLTAVVGRVISPLRRRGALACVLVASTYFVAVTFEFQVARYFSEGLDLALARDMGGGNLSTAFHYIEQELLGLLPLLGAGVVAFVITGMLLRRFGGRMAAYFDDRSFWQGLTRPKRLVQLNLLLVVLTGVVHAVTPMLERGLDRSFVHRVYEYPLVILTDFDLDGYGLMRMPSDHAPFDGDRYPYAVEKVGNGVDENGVGGDLAVLESLPPLPTWRPDSLARRNVVLVVFESARADLLEAKYGDQWVMPALRAAPGQPLRMISHCAFTTPSVVGILSGVMSSSSVEVAKQQSLFKRFGALGYRTGVFSGQHEEFGQKALLAGMHDADVFFDASREDPDRRMYGSTDPASLKIPGKLMVDRFFEWLDGARDEERPFFAYINFQEIHFPYHFEGGATPLDSDPLPRRDIRAENRDRLVRTYHNAARRADEAFGKLADGLAGRSLFTDTLILAVGDHGEELFDDGSLGHGTKLSFEQNAALGKLIHSSWKAPSMVGLADCPSLLHNGLVTNPEALIILPPYIFGYTGQATEPRQIGIFDESGLLRYDFAKDSWSRQPRPGAHFEPATSDLRLIHRWESYVIERLTP
ncbi:MAG: sulfatase-like hydrolase/transferase, partial [Planctomycetes bacterium]|nr:sulfatase-like hydrolase/transferase [Planctomycetota bacterium]